MFVTGRERKRALIEEAIEAELERFYRQYDIRGTLPEFGVDLREFVMRPSGRLRPLLFLTVLESYGVRLEQEQLAVAAAIELLHSCALLHDDLVDNAQTRRGAAAFHRSASPGVGQAVLGGDLLYTFAVHILLGTQPDPRRHRALSHILEVAAITSLAQFEEMHFIPQATPSHAIERIMELYDRKSGLYTFVAPIELARIFAGGPESDRQLLRAIGIHLGRAYQLRDDVIDIGSLAD
ncbi:MAG: polyprenyl synthetase family protein, partial [Cytophagales bacterium]|nr:polyprenyl synthetase family protein [Cytophagales bacterium]